MSSGFRATFENLGDLLALIGALFWAMHIIVVSIIVKRFSPYLIAFVQFLVCGILSLFMDLLFEKNIVLLDLKRFFWVAVTGIVITAFAYTLQIIVQSKAEPFKASIIFGLEAVFAAIAGYFVFKESLTLLEIIGCLLMFAGCLVSQYPGKTKIKGI